MSRTFFLLRVFFSKTVLLHHTEAVCRERWLITNISEHSHMMHSHTPDFWYLLGTSFPLQEFLSPCQKQTPHCWYNSYYRNIFILKKTSTFQEWNGFFFFELSSDLIIRFLLSQYNKWFDIFWCFPMTVSTLFVH